MAHANASLPPVLLGIGAGIAAYKIGTVIKHLRDRADMYVVMTPNATKLVGPATFASLTGHPVLVDLWDGSAHGNPVHIDVADIAKALCIAPATADVIGKLANGIADDALTTVAISVDCPIIVAPAMNVRMYRHPIVQENLQKLARFGYHIVEPDSGYLACGHVGPGRLADEARIAAAVIEAIDGRIPPVTQETYTPPARPTS